eukprot:SM000294S10819  [mRNA]  locus=s294:115581:128242:+ [translate_table: standard]
MAAFTAVLEADSALCPRSLGGASPPSKMLQSTASSRRAQFSSPAPRLAAPEGPLFTLEQPPPCSHDCVALHSSKPCYTKSATPASKHKSTLHTLPLRSLPDAEAIANSEDVLRIFTMACEVKQVKLSVIGLSCLQKLIAHDAVAPTALPQILTTLKEQSEVFDELSTLTPPLRWLGQHTEAQDESVQLKVLQTVLTLLQSRLHPVEEVQYLILMIQPAAYVSICSLSADYNPVICHTEASWSFGSGLRVRDAGHWHGRLKRVFGKLQDNMATALGICLRLIGNGRQPDSVHSTAAATLRQAVALIFDRVVEAEALPVTPWQSGRRFSRTTSVSGDVSRSIIYKGVLRGGLAASTGGRDNLSQAAKLGLKLLEDLHALAAGQPAVWLHVPSLPRAFAMDMIEYVLSYYEQIFRQLQEFEQALRTKISPLLMTSLRATGEIEGEGGEPPFRRLVLRAVATVTRLYASSFTTECEVFMSMLIKSMELDLPLWHRIMVLEVLRGFCVEARILPYIFQIFDMQPSNTNIVADMIAALAKVVDTVQVPEASEESLAAVAGMFSSKAKGVEWTMDYDGSGQAVVVASEAHAITLAVEGLLGVVFTVATLTDEAMDEGKLQSPKVPGDTAPLSTKEGGLVYMCSKMVDSVWHMLLDALSLMLARSQGEAVVLEILKGYQAFTQACGVLQATDARDAFLASLCRFTLVQQYEAEKSSSSTASPAALLSANIKRLDQALRTLFNVSHRLCAVLGGSSWAMVLETLAALDRTIHAPNATTQDAALSMPRSLRESAKHSSDFSILSTLDAQLFESSALMSDGAVRALLSALGDIEIAALKEVISGLGLAASGSSISAQSGVAPSGSKLFSTERMLATLSINLNRLEQIWDKISRHFLELANHQSTQVRMCALDALDRAILTALECSQVMLEADEYRSRERNRASNDRGEGSTVFMGDSSAAWNTLLEDEDRPSSNNLASTSGRVHLPGQLECMVVQPLAELTLSALENDVRAGSLRVLLHVLERHGEKLFHSWPCILKLLRAIAESEDGELILPAFQSVRVILNDCLSSVPVHLLNTSIELAKAYAAQKADMNISLTAISLLWTTADFFGGDGHGATLREVYKEADQLQSDEALLLAVRNAAIRTLFQSVVSHGAKFSPLMWQQCLWHLAFPLLEAVQHLAATSSSVEWLGKELGKQGGKAVHMLVHHSRNTAQKQWDETLVVLLNGFSRLLRSYFPLLLETPHFYSGWTSLLQFVRQCQLEGSKEVALAAVNALYAQVPQRYWESAISVYEEVLREGASRDGQVPLKARQEILENLGELYQVGADSFSEDEYVRLIALVDTTIRWPLSAGEPAGYPGTLPALQRTGLDILPKFSPKISRHRCLWPTLLKQLLAYLPGGDHLGGEHRLLADECQRGEDSSDCQSEEGDRKPASMSRPPSSSHLAGITAPGHSHKTTSATAPGNGHKTSATGWSLTNRDQDDLPEGAVVGLSHALAERAIVVLIKIHNMAPIDARAFHLPDLIAAVGRCMALRRDYPDAQLWHTAVVAFNSILDNILMQDEQRSLKAVQQQVDHADQDSAVILKASVERPRMWKELVNVYEKFLLGACGRALTVSSGQALPEDVQNADEALEIAVLDGLCDRVLTSCADASDEVRRRLVTVIDRCAARTSVLPISSISLLPAHCGRFSLACLHRLFVLSGHGQEADGETSSVVQVGRIAINVLVGRCNSILERFAADEAQTGVTPLPQMRLDEVTTMLQELARLQLHHLVAAAVDIPITHVEDEGEAESPGIVREVQQQAAASRLRLVDKAGRQLGWRRAHLMLLYMPLCELVLSPEKRTRELLRVLLRLVGRELGLAGGEAGVRTYGLEMSGS